MKISVVIPVYNDTRIYKALDSAIAQKDCETEIVVVDGCSNQETQDVIAKYRDYIDLFISEPDEGIFDAINKGIQRSSGDVIIALGADDRFNHPYIFRDVSQLLESNPTLEGCYGDKVMVNDSDKVIRYWKTGRYRPWKIYFGWVPPHFTLFLKREVYERCGYFDQNYPITADFDFIMRIFTKYRVNLGYLEDVLLRMTIGGNSNQSFASVVNGNRESLHSCQQQFHMCYFIHFWKLARKSSQLLLAKFYQDRDRFAEANVKSENPIRKLQVAK